MSVARALYLQSGGVTAVLNGSACGVIEAAHAQGVSVLAARNGFAGLLAEDLVDTDSVPATEIARLRDLPGGSFGASRQLLHAFDAAPAEWQRVREVLAAHDIGHVYVNGGNGSMMSAALLAELPQRLGYPLTVVGIPKTIDNDLLGTDCSPGFASAAKYLATSMREAGLDLRSMAGGKRVFILEVMGRHTGWLAAACALAAAQEGEPPQLVLMPEVPFDPARFLAAVADCLDHYGYCAIAAAEGLVDGAGRPLAEQQHAAIYGHEQLGGVAAYLAQLLRERLQVKCHYATADYLQRAARHLASAVDVEQAYAVGAAAVRCALAGESGVMTTIERLSVAPYRWQVGRVALSAVADLEWRVPAEFIRADGLQVTTAARDYLRPLIAGERPPVFCEGLPDYRPIAWPAVVKRLPDYVRG